MSRSRFGYVTVGGGAELATSALAYRSSTVRNSKFDQQLLQGGRACL